jgi:hypothetical protein
LEFLALAQKGYQKQQAEYWNEQVVMIPFEVQLDALDWVEDTKSHASLVLPPVSIQ